MDLHTRTSTATRRLSESEASVGLTALLLVACATACSKAGPQATPRADESQQATASASAPNGAAARDADKKASAPSAASSEPSAARDGGSAPGFDLALALAALPEDPAPPAIIKETHYVISNEAEPERFHDVLSGRGGIYVGVGSEQGLVFGGWSRAEALVLADFDRWVVEINELHGLLLRHASTPAEFLELWGAKRRSEVNAWITASTDDLAKRELRLQLHRNASASVLLRMAYLHRRFSDLKIPFFADDQAEFDHVAKLWRDGRVRSLLGDLTATRTLRAVGAMARDAAVPIRTVYLSNAEGYFTYEHGSFRENIKALYVDEKSVVVNTVPGLNGVYDYYSEDARSYADQVQTARSLEVLIRSSKRRSGGKHGAIELVPPVNASK
jgi:hypothetical protein